MDALPELNSSAEPGLVEEDTTLTNWMPAILAAHDHTSGRLLVVITADSSH